MRPLHALVVLLVLLVLAGAAWFLIQQDPTDAQVAPATSVETVESSGAAVQLDAPEGDADEVQREASQVTQLAEEAPVAASTTRIKGRVSDTWGNPIRNATVLVSAKDRFIRIPLDEIDANTPWIRRYETQTDSTGGFEIEAPEVTLARVGVRFQGFVPYDGEFPIEIGRTNEIGMLGLERSVILSGHVVDSSGQGVAGAELRRVRPGELDWSGMGRKQKPLSVTDAQGAFRIDQMAAGPWQLRIDHEEHPGQWERGETRDPGEVVPGLEVVLEDGVEIHGRVVGAPLELLQEMKVVCSEDLEVSEDIDQPQIRRSVDCKADGTFIVRGLRTEESYRLQGRSQTSDSDVFGRSHTEPVMARAGDRDVELRHREDTALVFQVVDDRTGDPIEEFDVSSGAQWMMRPLRDENGRFLTHHPEGRVRVGDLRLGAGSEGMTLEIGALGYETYLEQGIQATAGQEIDLGVLRLDPVPLVTVHVTDATTGKPVEGARVNLKPASTASGEVAEARFSVDIDIEEDHEGHGSDIDIPGLGRVPKTDENGMIQLSSLPGQTVRIEVKRKGYAPYHSELIELPLAKDYEHDVRIGPGASAVVTVVDSNGVPLANMRVEHEGPQPEGIAMDSAFDPRTTDGQGQLEFDNLEPGLHAFKVGGSSGIANLGGGGVFISRRTMGGPGRRSEDWTEVELAPGEEHELTLVTKPRAELSGRLSEDGLSLVGANLTLEKPGEAHMPGMGMVPGMGGDAPKARSAGGGEYHFDNVEVGTYTLKIRHVSRAMDYEVEVELDPGENEFDVDLPVAIIAGRITDAEGEPLAGVKVEAARSRGDGPRRQMRQIMILANDNGETTTQILGDNEFEPVYTDEEGAYLLRGVLTDVDLVVKASGGEVQPGESPAFHLAPGETREGVDLELALGGGLQIAVVREDGSPAGMCLVRANYQDEGDVEPQSGVTGEDGMHELQGLKPGTWRLSVRRMGFGGGGGSREPTEQDVEVEVGQNTPTRVTLP